MTIAQAIEESAWGQSSLAARYHNLFGIKGTGPAGSVALPTQEYENGSWVTTDAQFAVYHNDAESIADHAKLLATSGYYARAMADRAHPDAFANDLTGVYATDPGYGANLIALMKLYNLYQYDTAPTAAPAAASPARRTITPYGQRRHDRAVTPRPPSAGALPSSPPGTRRSCRRRCGPPCSPPRKDPWTGASTCTGTWPRPPAAAGSCWRPPTGCSAGPTPATHPSRARDSARSMPTAPPTPRRTAALAQCAADLIELSSAVYGIDLTARRPLSVRELAAAFAAFRWGALLKRHGVSPVEFPYSVAGLTVAHQKMRWPPVDAPGAPDRPGNPLPPAVRRGPRGPQPRLPGHRLTCRPVPELP